MTQNPQRQRLFLKLQRILKKGLSSVLCDLNLEANQTLWSISDRPDKHLGPLLLRAFFAAHRIAH